MIKETIGPAIGYRAIYGTKSVRYGPGFAVTLFHIGIISRAKIEAVGAAGKRVEELPLRRKPRVFFERLFPGSRQYERWAHLDDSADAPPSGYIEGADVPTD